MKWYKFSEKKPAYGEVFLAKIKDDDDCPYYVLRGSSHGGYEEASGEQYACWDEKELVGWCSCDEIEKNERWN